MSAALHDLKRGRVACLGVLTWMKNLNSEQISNVAWADPQRQTACEKWLSELATTPDA
jgi:hypothetical protein